MTDQTDLDFEGALPYDDDAYDPSAPQKPIEPGGPAVLGEAFSYIGQGLSVPQFSQYVKGYNFGAIKPSYVVLHHTAIPSIIKAKYPSGAVWDAGEAGLPDVQALYNKRKAQLDALARYYQAKGWPAGPHLFVDDIWIWLFSRMYDVGVHAAQGNSYHDEHGKLQYSIGLEVLGYYEDVTWPEKVAYNVGMAIAILKDTLGTFDYIDGPWAGKVGAHRMYNKPSCPGRAIQPAYYMPILRDAYARLSGATQPGGAVPAPAPAPANTVDKRFMLSWQNSGGVWQANRLTPGNPTGPAYQKDGLWHQRFERSVARQDANGAISWLLLSEIAQNG